jgi:hypothetical protein
VAGTQAIKAIETSMFADRESEDYLCHAWTT